MPIDPTLLQQQIIQQLAGELPVNPPLVNPPVPGVIQGDPVLQNPPNGPGLAIDPELPPAPLPGTGDPNLPNSGFHPHLIGQDPDAPDATSGSDYQQSVGPGMLMPENQQQQLYPNGAPIGNPQIQAQPGLQQQVSSVYGPKPVPPPPANFLGPQFIGWGGADGQTPIFNPPVGSGQWAWGPNPQGGGTIPIALTPGNKPFLQHPDGSGAFNGTVPPLKPPIGPKDPPAPANAQAQQQAQQQVIQQMAPLPHPPVPQFQLPQQNNQLGPLPPQNQGGKGGGGNKSAQAPVNGKMAPQGIPQNIMKKKPSGIPIRKTSR